MCKYHTTARLSDTSSDTDDDGRMFMGIPFSEESEKGVDYKKSSFFHNYSINYSNDIV